MIFQEPMTALNPVMRIGDQIAEVFEAHGLLTPKERRAKALALSREVGLPDPERIVRAYPHQLSGGQRQRAMIAMALALEPAVLIADEPTTALDVTTQAQILRLIRDLQRRRNMAVLFITHDFGVVAEIADRVVVLQKGKVVEEGTAATCCSRRSIPIPGRCSPPCRTCSRRSERPCSTAAGGRGDRPGQDLCQRRRLFRAERRVHAAKDVNFDIRRGETLGLVGESGSGKSTVARLVMRLIEADAGAVRIGDIDLTRLDGQALRVQRRRIQMVFQDPFASLNPRRTVGHIIADGPIAHGVAGGSANSVPANCSTWSASMPARSSASRMNSPAASASASASRARWRSSRTCWSPTKPVSALDVSVQAQVLDLLETSRPGSACRCCSSPTICASPRRSATASR